MTAEKPSDAKPTKRTCGRCGRTEDNEVVYGAVQDFPAGWGTVTLAGQPWKTQTLCSDCIRGVAAYLNTKPQVNPDVITVPMI